MFIYSVSFLNPTEVLLMLSGVVSCVMGGSPACLCIGGVSLYSPYTLLFLFLISISICFMAIPDMDWSVGWFLLVLFTVVAISPDSGDN